MNLICPICGERLSSGGRSLVCPGRHSFDIARQGYVYLLPVQQKHSHSPGDTREQVLSRRRFLESGVYQPILDALTVAARERQLRGSLLDIGCGEGWYGHGLQAATGMALTGLDISKEAVRCAAGKYKDARWLCASASRLPVESQSADLITSLFAVTFPEEFRRVLKEKGFLFQVLAAQDHLMGLKSIIYDRILLREKDSAPALPGFCLEQSIPIRFSFTLEGEAIRDLFSMTPHVYRIGRDGADRLSATQRLTDEASCVLNIYSPG